MHSTPSTVADPSVEAALSALEAGLAQVSKVHTDALSQPDRLIVLARVETVVRALPGLGLELIAQLREQWSVEDFGGARVTDTIADTLRITPGEARARYRASDDLAPSTSTSGAVIEPVMTATATALRDGAIGGAHVKLLRDCFHHLPACVDHATRTRVEADLARHARMLRPDELGQVIGRVEAILNPDGHFTDTDRARRRGFTLGRQGPDLMSKCSVVADPELRAYLETMFAKYAKPGACNPEDTTPIVDAEPDAQAVQRDGRSAAQRQHDALKAALRATLASGDLGQHRGLPVTVVVSMGLADLETAATAASRAADGEPVTYPQPVVTGGGSLLPIRDALRMAAHAHHYLAVFDDTDGRPLYLGRSKRIATADQRIVLHARDIGCSFPGCAKPGYLCQTHHRSEWADGGGTDADQLTFVCEPHHRMAGTRDTDWTTTPAPPGHRNPGRTQWIPPAHVDPHRRPRTNRYHHPGEYLTPEGDSGTDYY